MSGFRSLNYYPTDQIVMFPAANGTMPATKWFGAEWPDPTEICPPLEGASGAPSFVYRIPAKPRGRPTLVTS